MKFALNAAIAALSFVAVGSAPAALVINEIYPGGGGSTGVYTRDFVEIYNTDPVAVSLAGYSLQYASASGNFTNTIVSFGAGSTIAAKDYITIATGSAGSGGSTLTAGQGAGFVTYVAPTTTASLQASNGAIRLVNGSTLVDLVGYGSVSAGSLNEAKFETAAASSPTSNAVSINRTNFGDSNNNASDFSSATPSPNGGTAASIVAVPEPMSLAGLGLAGLALVRRRRA